MKQHNYQRKIDRMIAEGKLPAKAGLAYVDVHHDDWCAIHNGGICNCDPDIVYTRIEEDNSED